jgi:hypothetical protein
LVPSWILGESCVTAASFLARNKYQLALRSLEMVGEPAFHPFNHFWLDFSWKMHGELHFWWYFCGLE